MNLKVRQISSLEKIRSAKDIPAEDMRSEKLLRGESFSYQVVLCSEADEYSFGEWYSLQVSVESPLKEAVKLYRVENAYMDMPTYPDSEDADYITREPGPMPDILVPLEHYNHKIKLENGLALLWVTVTVPEDYPAGEYPVELVFTGERVRCKERISFTRRISLQVLPVKLPAQRLKFTQWFHVDCIAQIHNVPIYSEAHWELIGKYMELARELGINMILTPVITPPLDTAMGTTRPCTQLVRIEKSGDSYTFDFTLLRRWLLLCEEKKIEYFEISHLFSQWGLQCAPNIKVRENGEESYLFGWHVEAKDLRYEAFLRQFVPALIDFLKNEGVFERCYFHISDEPNEKNLENYRYAHDLLAPMVAGAHLMDALSNPEFCELGLVDVPVTATNHIEPFLAKNLPHQWAYYCCGQHHDVGNRFLAMPSYRNRILGVQLYKYHIEGFLQWGYNYYNSGVSEYTIHPYITTSGDRCYPSGDPFSVYPYRDGVVPSLRAVVFKEALQDIRLLELLESYAGREEVLALLEKEAGMNITFKEYPRNAQFLPRLGRAVKREIERLAIK